MSSEVPDAPSPSYGYFADEIIIYGVMLGENKLSLELPFDRRHLKLKVKKRPAAAGAPAPADDEDDTGFAIVVAYGYAYEGSCYRLDRPRLLILDPRKRVRQPNGAPPREVEGEEAHGCGFDSELGYRMWRIRKVDSIVDITFAMGAAEDLLLQGNLPGNKAPNTYGNAMAVAHRGKLNKFGPPS